MAITFTHETRSERDAAIRRHLAAWAAQQGTITAEALSAALDQALAAAPTREGVTLEYQPEQQAALGADVATMADWLDTALLALAALRTGKVRRDGELTDPDAEFWYLPIDHLYHRLLPRLRGIEEAAIREHHAAGGSLSHLAQAMDVDARSTAQYRRSQVIDQAPSSWERWARSGGPQQPQRLPAGV